MGEFRSSYVTEFGRDDSASITIGGITGVSRQLWINGAAALGNLSQAQGRRLAADVSDRMVAYLVQNSGNGPNMKDTAVGVLHCARRAWQRCSISTPPASPP